MNILTAEIITSEYIPQEIVSGLLLLWSTPKGTVALDREYGINWDFIDLPINIAKQKYSIEVISQTKKYEPRISISKIEFKYNLDDLSKLTPIITIRNAKND